MRLPTLIETLDGVPVTPFEDFAVRVLLKNDTGYYYATHRSIFIYTAVIKTIRECRENNDSKYDFIKRIYGNIIFKYYMKLKKKWFYTKLPQIPFSNEILFKESVKLYAKSCM